MRQNLGRVAGMRATKFVEIKLPAIDLSAIGNACGRIPLNPGFPQWRRWMFRKGIVQLVEATLLAARPGVKDQDLHDLIGPLPAADFRHIVAVPADILLVFDELVAQELFEVRAHAL